MLWTIFMILLILWGLGRSTPGGAFVKSWMKGNKIY